METTAPTLSIKGNIFMTGIGSQARTESGTPTSYRLVRYSAYADLVLQGSYGWAEGGIGGYQWRDIPTVDLFIMEK